MKLALVLLCSTFLHWKDVRWSDDLVSMERRSWVAWQNHNAKFFEDFLSDDHIEVGVSGPSAKRSVVSLVASSVCHVTSYKLDRFSVRRFDENNAALTYWAEQDTTCGATTVATPVWVTSMYQKRNGRWWNIVYVHTPIPHTPNV